MTSLGRRAATRWTTTPPSRRDDARRRRTAVREARCLKVIADVHAVERRRLHDYDGVAYEAGCQRSDSALSCSRSTSMWTRGPALRRTSTARACSIRLMSTPFTCGTQQGVGWTHQQGVGCTHQQGVGCTHQQGVGCTHQQGVGCTHQHTHVLRAVSFSDGRFA